MYTPAQRASHGCDFEDGFKAGFLAASTGDNCEVPAVSPPKYWSAKYQTCEGQAFVQDWFRGYQCGLASADAQGYSQFKQVPVSPKAPILNHSGCGQCYSPDRCQCQSAGTSIPHDISGISSELTSDAAVATAQPLPQSMPVDGMGAGASAATSPSDLATVRADYFSAP